MTVVAIRKTSYVGFTDEHRHIIQNASPNVTLGDPAEWQTASGAVWCVFDDPRISLEQAAVIGSIASNWSKFPASYEPPNDPQALYDDVVRILGVDLIPPDQIAYSGEDNFQETLTAQGAPTTVAVFAQMPSTWRPYLPPQPPDPPPVPDPVPDPGV